MWVERDFLIKFVVNIIYMVESTKTAPLSYQPVEKAYQPLNESKSSSVNSNDADDKAERRLDSDED